MKQNKGRCGKEVSKGCNLVSKLITSEDTSPQNKLRINENRHIEDLNYLKTQTNYYLEVII